MNERTIQIDVIGKIEGTQFMKCKLYTNENIVIIMMNEFDYERLKEGYEYNAIRDAVQYVTNKHDFGYFIQPWKDEFLRMPFDVTKRKKWADYVAECHATGKEIDYDNYDWDK